MQNKIASELKVIMEKKAEIKKIQSKQDLKKQKTLIEKEKLEQFSEYQDDKAWWKELEKIGENQIAKKLT